MEEPQAANWDAKKERLKSTVGGGGSSGIVVIASAFAMNKE